MSADPSVMTSLAVFLREYHRALSVGDAAYLEAHTTLPLSFSQAELDMEAKVFTKKLRTIADLLKVRRLLRWPQNLVPRGPEDLAQLKRGRQKCDDPKHPSIPNWKQGEPAVEIAGDVASLSYLAMACAAETHVVILRFVREANTWRLRERAIHLGTT